MSMIEQDIATLRSSATLIEDYLDAVIRKDTSVVDRFFAPDVEYMINGTPIPDPDGVLPPLSAECREALPWLGLYQGREALAGFLRHMHHNLDVLAFGPREVISEGDKAAAFGWFRLQAASTGRTVDVAYAIRFELRDGLIARYHFLENTYDVATAFRTGGSWRVNTDGREHESPPALSVQVHTASEPAAWANSYLICGGSEALLFDVPMLRSEAAKVADMVAASGKTLTTIFISHAHPDHFLGLDVIAERFPQARIVSTANVAADIAKNGAWMVPMLQGKLGAEGPQRLIVPEALAANALTVGGAPLQVVEFGEGESEHMATLLMPEPRTLLCADLVYNGAHLYLQEKRLESWLAQLDNFERFVASNVTVLYPGHGPAGDSSLIDSTRAYLRDFAAALKLGDARAVEQRMLALYPDYHARQFLTVFSVPAYFPAPTSDPK